MGRPTMRDPKHPHWPDDGERTELRDVAERWKWAYVDLAHGNHRRRVLGTKNARTLGKAIAEYLPERERAVEPRTFAGDRSVLKHLARHFKASAPVHTLDVQELVAALLDRGYKPSTVRQYTMNLRAFWAWLDLPFPEVSIPEPGTEGVRFWTDEEVETLRAHAATMEPAVLLSLDVALFMGLRIGEILALRWEDIDPDAWMVRVRRQIPQGRTTPKPLKGKRARTALVLSGWQHPPGDGLVVHRDGNVVGRRVQWRWMRDLLDATGLNHMGAGYHMGRHTYARMVLEGGGTLEQLRQFLGHASITTTEQSYGWLRQSEAIRSARKVLHEQ